MAEARRAKGPYVPLIIENHPDEYEGYPFITLVQYRKDDILSIVDNATDSEISLYVLDLCGPEQVNEEQVIAVAKEWYNTNKGSFPISIEFSRRGLTMSVGKIYKTYNLEFITRVIGPVPTFDMLEVHSVKRRRKKVVPPGVEIHNNVKFDWTS